MNNGEIVSFVWGVADLIRDTFRRGHYQDVILPLTILRRLDCGAQDILKILRDFKDGDTRLVKKDGAEEETIVSRIYPTTHFGFRKHRARAAALRGRRNHRRSRRAARFRCRAVPGRARAHCFLSRQIAAVSSRSDRADRIAFRAGAGNLSPTFLAALSSTPSNASRSLEQGGGQPACSSNGKGSKQPRTAISSYGVVRGR